MDANQLTTAATTALDTARPPAWRGVLNSIAAWPLSRKIATVAVLAITMALLAFLVIQARVADQQLLFANLEEESAASVVSWLKNQKIPYTLKNGGKNIWIPADRIYETRLELAASGLPSGGGVGFEVFDKQSFALTDYVQKVNHTRALQGELARTITSLEPVESTRVHLALPEKRLFKDQQRKPTASVIVTLKSGRTLDKKQVQGIVHLVAGSIPELEAGNVKIIDSKGVELKAEENTDKDKLVTMDMLAYQQEVEQRLEMRAQDMLDKTMGPDKAMVRVSASLDFARNEKTQELYDAEEPVVRSEQISSESSGTQTAGGVPGVQSNLQGASGNQGASSPPPTNKSSKTTNYEISKTLSKTVNPVGTITKLSVSVLVADKLEGKEKDKPPVAVARSPEELKEIENMVRTAIGMVPTRGDQINVLSMPFIDQPAPNAQAADGGGSYYQYLPLAKMAAIPLAALLLYFMLVRPIIKTMRSEVQQHYKTVEEMEQERQRQLQAANSPDNLPPPSADDEIVRVRREVMQNQVPTAYIVKNWIQEG